MEYGSCLIKYKETIDVEWCGNLVKICSIEISQHALYIKGLCNLYLYFYGTILFGLGIVHVWEDSVYCVVSSF